MRKRRIGEGWPDAIPAFVIREYQIASDNLAARLLASLYIVSPTHSALTDAPCCQGDRGALSLAARLQLYAETGIHRPPWLPVYSHQRALIRLSTADLAWFAGPQTLMHAEQARGGRLIAVNFSHFAEIGFHNRALGHLKHPDD
jgi:hypothetical protein